MASTRSKLDLAVRLAPVLDACRVAPAMCPMHNTSRSCGQPDQSMRPACTSLKPQRTSSDQSIPPQASAHFTAQPHLEQRPVCILLGDLKREALDHCRLHLAHILEHFALLDGYGLLIFGVNQSLEFCKALIKLLKGSKAGILRK